MKTQRSKIALVSILITLVIWGYIAVIKQGFIPNGLELLIFLFILIAGVYAFFVQLKKHAEENAGYPTEDEMSTRIKHKAGYYSFITSMYIWLFLFLFKRYIPDVETLLGTGILLSGIISMLIKAYVSRHYHEDQN